MSNKNLDLNLLASDKNDYFRLLVSVWTVFFIICTAIVSIIPLQLTVDGAGATYEVGDGKTYSTIGAAYNQVTSGNGDTIIVYEGEYTETLHIQKSHLTIDAYDSDDVIWDGSNSNYVIKISASDVRISDFTIRDASGNAIELRSQDCTIQNNQITDAQALIYINSGEGNSILSNTLTRTTDDEDWGVYVTSNSLGNVIDDNIIDNMDADGIYLTGGSNYNTITSNTIRYCGDGIHYSQCGISTGSYAIKSNYIHENNNYGIHIDEGNGYDITENRFQENVDYAIYLDSTTGANTWKNNFIGNKPGGADAQASDDGDHGDNWWDDNDSTGNHWDDLSENGGNSENPKRYYVDGNGSYNHDDNPEYPDPFTFSSGGSGQS